MQRLRAGITFVLLAASITSPFIANAQVGAQTSLSQFGSGCHPITAEETAGLKAMGATIPANGQFCDKDKPLLNGGCDENPYPYLQTKNKTGRPDAVSGLNSDFACRMSKFFKAATAEGMNISIGSGYRSIAHQTSLYNAYIACGKCGAPVAPPGRSKHNFGLAIDLSFNGRPLPRTLAICSGIPECKWAHSNEAKFGLRYPMDYEPWHIEPSGTVNGKQQPLPEGGWNGDQNQTPYTNNGTPYNPNMWQPQTPPPQPQQFSPLGGSGNTGASTPTQTTSGNQYLPTNYDGTPVPIDTYVPTSSGTSTATSTVTTKINNGPSAAEQIDLMTGGSNSYNGSQSSPTSTSAPTRLNDDLNDIGSTNTGGANISDDLVDGRLAENSVALNPIHVTQTFSGNEPTVVQATSGANAAANKSLIVALLTTLRDLLVSFVNVLKSQNSYGFEGAWRAHR